MPMRAKFDVSHAMNCKRGGFITMRHDNIRDFEANLLAKVCKDVEVEPALQPLTGEHLSKSIMDGDEARLDVRARGFWRKGQNTFFDVRVTNASARSQQAKSIDTVLQRHGRERSEATTNEL